MRRTKLRLPETLCAAVLGLVACGDASSEAPASPAADLPPTAAAAPPLRSTPDAGAHEASDATEPVHELADAAAREDAAPSGDAPADAPAEPDRGRQRELEPAMRPEAMQPAQPSMPAEPSAADNNSKKEVPSAEEERPWPDDLPRRLS